MASWTHSLFSLNGGGGCADMLVGEYLMSDIDVKGQSGVPVKAGSFLSLRSSMRSPLSQRDINGSQAPRKGSIFVLLPTSRFKMFWEFIGALFGPSPPAITRFMCPMACAVMIPIIYTVTAMPIDLFYLANDGNVWSALDTTVAVIFGVDIILCFFSAYIDDNNTLITDL